MASNEKFWMYDVTQLFRSYELLPSPEDTLSAKLNTITRLALIGCIAIAAYKPMLAFSTLIIVMVVAMSVHAGAVADPTIEGFEPVDGLLAATTTNTKLYGSNDPYGLASSHNVPYPPTGNQQLFEFMREYNSTRFPDLNKVGFPTTQKRFCNDAVPLEYGPYHVSPNQELVGGPNPKTRIPPLVAAPSHDLDSWRNNDFVVHSQINKETNFDAERSGYNHGILPTKCEDCMYVPCQCKVLRGNQRGVRTEGEVPPPEVTFVDPMDVVEGFREEFGRGPRGGEGRMNRRGGETRPSRAGRGGGGKPPGGKPGWPRRDAFLDRRLGDNFDEEDDETFVSPHTRERWTPCFESPRRDNIITQTLQPGVFQKSHIGEPIQSNIGISYLQEWGPTEVQETNNMIKYTMRDPKNVITTPQIKEEVIGQDHTNVYDPRFTGYGTSYRSYTDQLTGRPKFFYDDVDAITMPNYVTRSNVDVFPWANTYGPDKMMSQSDGDEYRQLANNAFTDSAIAFRTELQERLMRKRNAELWQRRVAPISTMGRLGSSMKSCL